MFDYAYFYYMKKYNYLLIFFLFTLSVNSQNFKEYQELVNKSRTTTDNDSIIYYLEKATLGTKNPFPKQLLSLGFQYYKRGNVKKAHNAFIKAIDNGYQFESDKKRINYYVEYNSNFIDAYTKQKYPYHKYMVEMHSKNKKKAKKHRKKFLKNINKEQDESFEVLLQNEYYFQTVRLDILPKQGVSSDTLSIVAKYLPSGNSYTMLKLLKQDSFPKRYKCARFNNQSINILLNHAVSGFANKNDAEEFINLLWQEVEKGNISPYDYALAYDHYIAWYVDTDKTYFGTTLRSVEGVEGLVYMDVLHPKELNEIRKKYWLNSIESSAESTGFMLPLNYNK